MAPMKPIPLTSLQPSWWPTPDRKDPRFRVGMRFNCPCGDKTRDEHGPHRLIIWFANPERGDEPEPGKRYIWRAGDSFGDITLATQGEPLGDPIPFAGHVDVWVVEGEVYWRPLVSEEQARLVLPASEGSA